MMEHLIEAEDLLAIADDADVRIVDATYIASFVDPDTDGVDLFEEAHIPGAVFFDIDEIADKNTSLPHMLPEPEQFARQVGAFGISADDRIVCYDQNSFTAAARAWWMFRLMGAKQVAVLNGGLEAWQRAGGQVEYGSSASIAPAIFTPAPMPQLAADVDMVKTAISNQSAIIFDARSVARFNGLAPEPREGLKGGHMPGAICTPFNQLIDDDGRLVDKQAVKTFFADACADLNAPIITTCGSGVTAAILALGLAVIGREDVAVYDGSWSEWGARDDCPCAT